MEPTCSCGIPSSRVSVTVWRCEWCQVVRLVVTSTRDDAEAVTRVVLSEQTFGPLTSGDEAQDYLVAAMQQLAEASGPPFFPF